MKRCIFSVFGNFLSDYIKKIYYPKCDKDKILMILEDDLFEKLNIPFKLKQCEINSMDFHLIRKEISIDKISLNNNVTNDIASNQIKTPNPIESSNQIMEPKKKNIFSQIACFLLMIGNFFLTIFNFLFGYIISMIKNFCIKIIKQLMTNVKINVNVIEIMPEVPKNDSNKSSKIQISLTNINFVLKNVDDLKYETKIDKIQINLRKRINKIIISKVKILDIKFEGEKMKTFSIEIKSISLKNPSNKRFIEPIQIKEQISFSFKHDEGNNIEPYEIKMKLPNIFFVIDFDFINKMKEFFNDFENKQNSKQINYENDENNANDTNDKNEENEIPNNSIQFIDYSIESKVQTKFYLEINETKFILPYFDEEDDDSNKNSQEISFTKIDFYLTIFCDFRYETIIENFQVNLKDHMNQIISNLTFTNLGFSGERMKSFKIELDSFVLENPLSRLFMEPVQINNKITFSFCHDFDDDPYEIKLNVSKISFVVDFEFLLILIQFFNNFQMSKNPKKCSSKNKELPNNSVALKSQMLFNFEINETKFILPNFDEEDENIQQIIFGFDSMKFKNVENSFNYEFCLDSAQIFCNEEEITDKININVFMDKSDITTEMTKINLNFDSFSFYITTSQILMIKRIINNSNEKIKMIQNNIKNDNNENTHKIETKSTKQPFNYMIDLMIQSIYFSFSHEQNHINGIKICFLGKPNDNNSNINHIILQDDIIVFEMIFSSPLKNVISPTSVNIASVSSNDNEIKNNDSLSTFVKLNLESFYLNISITNLLVIHQFLMNFVNESNQTLESIESSKLFNFDEDGQQNNIIFIYLTNINFVLKNLDDLKYEAKIDKIQINLFSKIDVIISKGKILDIKFEGEKMKTFSIEIKSISLKNPSNKRFIEPIQIKEQISFSFKHEEGNNIELYEIKMKLPNIFFVIDFDFINKMKEFFNDFENKQNSSRINYANDTNDKNEENEIPNNSIQFIDYSIESKDQTKFSLEINETKFILPNFDEEDGIIQQIVFGFDSMKFKNVENYFNYKFLLDSAQIFCNKEEITDKININVFMDKSDITTEMTKINLNFNSFSFYLTKSQILMIKRIINNSNEKIKMIQNNNKNDNNDNTHKIETKSTKQPFNYNIDLMIRSIYFSFSCKQNYINGIKISFLNKSDDDNSNSKEIVSEHSINVCQEFLSNEDNLVFELIFSTQSQNDIAPINVKMSSTISNDDEITDDDSMPMSVKLKLESFDFNVSIIRLFEISQFLNRFVNKSSPPQENKKSTKSFNYDVKIPSFNVGILYDEKGIDYYLLKVNNVNANTINSAHNHHFWLDKLELIDKSEKFSDFTINNLNGTLSMILIDDEINASNDQNSENNEIDSTDNSIYQKNIKISCDYFDFNYSHQFATDILNIVNLMKNENYLKQKNTKNLSTTNQNSLNLSFDFESSKTNIYVLLDEKAQAHLFIDLLHIYIDMKNSMLNVELNEMALFDNIQSTVFSIYEFIINSNSDNFLINLEEFNLNMKLHYIVNSIEYIQISPFMEFNEKSKYKYKVKGKNDQNKKKIYFSVNYIKASIHFITNIISFLFGIDVTIDENDKKIDIFDIYSLLNEKAILDPFSVNLDNSTLSFSPISAYIPLNKLNIFNKIIDETKSISSEISKILSQKDLSDDDDQNPNDNDDNENNNKNKYKISISNIIIFIIKSNSPLFSLGIQPTNFVYPFVDKQNCANIEIKLLLKHFSHGIYNIINQFAIIFIIKENLTRIIVSPMIVTLSSFLFEEIFSAEKDVLSNSNYKYQDKILFFQNDTSGQIHLTLTKKNSNENYIIELNNNYPELIKEVEYMPDIEATFNENKIQSFSLKNLYSPIFLSNNIIASPNSESGVRMVHFSSPYKIVNNLHYDIGIIVNGKNIGMIGSGKEIFIPCKLNFSLSGEINVARYPVKSDYQIINFKKPNLITLYDSENKRNCYSIVHLSFDSEKSIGSIILMPYIKFINYLPIPLTLSIVNFIECRLDPNQSVDLSFLNDAKDISILLDFNEFAMGNKLIQLKRIQEFKKEVELCRKGKKIGKIILKCLSKKYGNKKFYEFVIYSPLILENKSKIPLAVRIPKNISYSFIDDFIFYSSESLLKYECSIIIPLYSPDLTEDNENKFNILGDFSQVFRLKHKSNKQFYFLVSLTKRKGYFLDSSIVSIQPYLKVINNTNMNVTFISIVDENKKSPIEYKNVCGVGESYIKGSNDKCTFNLVINEYQECFNVNLCNIGTSLIRFINKKDNESDLLIKLVVKKEDNGYCCYISNPTFPSPITITNLLTDNESIFIHQYYQNDDKSTFKPMEIIPNCTSLFAKEQPFLQGELKDKYNVNISFGSDKKQYPLSFEVNCHSKRINDTDYLFDVQTIDNINKLITIYKSNRHDDYKENIKKKKGKMSFFIYLTEIQISYIDKEMHDLFLIVIKEAKLSLDKTKLEFEIGGFSINDMYSASYAPVALNVLTTPFLKAEINTVNPLKMHILDNISIQLSPLQIFVDFPFVGDLVAVMKEIINYCSSKQSKSEQKQSGNNFLMEIISIQQISIEEIKLSLIPKKVPNRKFRFDHPDHWGILHYKVPSDKEYEYSFVKYNNSNIEAPITDLWESIFDSYKNQFTFKKVVKSLLASLSNKPIDPKTYEDLLANNCFNGNVKLEYPLRIPRSFPKNMVLDIRFNINSSQYICSLVQFKFQKLANGSYRDEKLLELYKGQNSKWLAIFENYIFVYDYQNENESFKIKIVDIKNVITNNETLVIYYGEKNENFICKNEQSGSLIIKKINSIRAKISILAQFD